MHKRLFFFIFLSAFFYSFNSCSISDADTEDRLVLPDITVLGRNQNAILQTNIEAGTTVSNFNLTQTLGIPTNGRLMELYNYDTTLGYYFSPPFDDTYTVWSKNMTTNLALIYNNFCGETTLETPYFPQVSEDHITVFTAELISTGNRVLNLRIYNKALEFCSKTSIGISDQFQQLTRLIIGNSILTYHFDNQGQTVISKIAMETGALQGQLTFNTSGAATVRDGRLYFYPSSGNVSQFSYDLATLQLLASSSFSVNPFLGTGLFKSESLGNAILIDRNYIQPFEFTTFPALLDQETGDITKLADLGVINSNLISFVETDLAIQTSQFYTVDLGEKLVIGSYTLFNFDVTIIEYGIYYADFSGEILEATPIDFKADEIIIR